MKEIWKDIEDQEGHYLISTLGLVKSLKRRREKILKPAILRGYSSVSLCHGKSKRHYVHRLVAIAFIPNPENKPQVNHKKGIKLDNRASELEWCTASDNQLHSFRELGTKPTWTGKFGKDNPNSKPVSQYSKEGKFINTFVSQSEAGKITGIANGIISLACSGKKESAGGYLWKFNKVHKQRL